jgi:hypothetical protein
MLFLLFQAKRQSGLIQAEEVNPRASGAHSIFHGSPDPAAVPLLRCLQSNFSAAQKMINVRQLS